MKDVHIENNSVTGQYISALYWAVTTVITVGYGDILPTNLYEMSLTCIIIVLGVVIFSFLLSNLAN